MKHFKNLMLFAAGSLLLSGCVDDAYDLSNIDTSAELKVNGLALPLKIDNITLDDVINLENNGRIKVLNGEYVLVEEGYFESDDIMIDPIHADAPDSESSTNYLDLVIPDAYEQKRQTGSDELFTAEYHLKEDFSNYKYDIQNISEHLISLDKIEAEMSISTKLRIEGLDSNDHFDVDFKDITLRLPKGMDISNHPGTYDPETGVLFIKEIPTVNNSIELGVSIHSIDLKKAGMYLDEYLHSMTFDEKITIAEGKIVVTTDDISKLPKQIAIVKNCDFSDIDVKSFSGTIKYDFAGFDINPISLTGLPSVLTQEQTDIKIANPQIYLSINNPAAEYKVSAQAGIKFTTHRNGMEDQVFTLDNGFFTLGYDKGSSDQLFCFSPMAPQTYYTGFDGAQHIAFSNLGNILSGKGLPSSIDISLVNPCIPEQTVEGVELGKNMGKVKGHYVFFSPLALAKESIIVYSDVLDGINSEELDDLTITDLDITTDITTDLPINLKLVGYPIDKYGNRINDVKIEGAEIPANSTNYPLNIKIHGEVKHLDGIQFEATATSDGSNASLKPSQSVSLKNIKVKVSGKYTTQL